MRPVIRTIQALRIYMLLFTLPYVLLWTQVFGDAAAILLVLMHSLLVIFCITSSDRRMLQAGIEPRIPLSRSSERRELAAVESGRIIVGSLLLITILLMLFIQPILALVAALIATSITIGGSPTSPRGRRWCLHLIELRWGLIALVIPMLIIADLAEQAGRPLPNEAAGATLLGALLLTVFLLLCLLRDEPENAGQKFRTIVTSFGRGGAMAYLFVLLSLTMMLAMAGSSVGHWSWVNPGIIAISAMACFWLIAAGAEEYAVGLWFLASLVTAFGVSVGMA